MADNNAASQSANQELHELTTLCHYTDALGRAGIELDGRIRPSTDLLGEPAVFLTPDRYATRSEAQTRLAARIAVAGYFEIPIDLIRDLQGPVSVVPLGGWAGGGTEFYTTKAIRLDERVRWVSIP